MTNVVDPDLPTRQFTVTEVEDYPDYTLREQLTRNHEVSQKQRWERIGPMLSERKRAELLRHLELEVVWDQLDDRQRACALEAVQEDADWPGLFDRMRAEREEAGRQAAEAEAAAEAEMLKGAQDLADTRAELIAILEKRAEEQHKQEEREVVERKHRTAAERKRLRQARDKAIEEAA